MILLLSMIKFVYFMLIELLFILMINSISVATLNVNGLRNDVKRRQIFDSCGRQGIDVLLLQETHAAGYPEARAWGKEFDGKGYWSFGKPSSCGVAILLSKRHSWKPADIFRDNKGRIISATVTFPGTHSKVRIVNCYAPNSPADRQRLFVEQLPSHLRGMRRVIMGGDFNCISDIALDTKQVRHQNGLRGSRELFKISKDFGLQDCWRVEHPNLKRFTWHNSNNTSATRIDRIYLSRELSVGSENVIAAFPWSDHDIVISKIKTKSQQTGKGVWKFNTSHLKEEMFNIIIKSEWEHWQRKKQQFASVLDWWDEGKNNLKRAAITFSIELSRSRNAERKRLLSKLNSLQQRSDNGDAACAEQIKVHREMLQQNIDLCRYKPRCFDIYGEDCTHVPKQNNPDSKRMQCLRGRDGHVTSDPVEMTDTCRRFYEDLYETVPVDQMEINFLLGKIQTSLAPEENMQLEGPVTLAEVRCALFDMETGKSPGLDGLPADFYRAFFSDMGQDLTDILNAVFDNGQLSESQKSGLITLLYKNKGNREELTNWRPISLLNVDYKILAKILTNRAKKILPSIVNSDQTCSVAGRSILDNAHLLRNVQDYVEQKDIGAVFVSLDQRKAFDRVNWWYLRQVLEKFGFGPNFCKWVKILYTDINSSVLCNGDVSRSFSLSRGVRQGCPLSPLLYILSLEPLACAIREEKIIHGVKLPGGTEARISMYADDTTLILSDENSITRSFSLIDRYERASGAKLNQQKSNGVFIGKWKNKRTGPVDIAWVTSDKIVGIYFGNGDVVGKLWAEKIIQLEKSIEKWDVSDLTMKGRVTVVNIYILTKIWYIAEITPPPKKIIRKINSLIFPFIWGIKLEHVNRATMFLPPSKGGWGVIDIKSKMATMHCSHVGNIISARKTKWKELAIYWCGFHLREIAPILAVNTRPHCFHKPFFYTQVIQNFHKCRDCVADWNKVKVNSLYASVLEDRGTTPRVELKNPGKDWATVWERTLCTKTSNKQTVFTFKILHGFLPTGSVLRKYTTDPGKCPHCAQIETVYHVFSECRVVKPVGRWLGDYLDCSKWTPDVDTLVYSLFTSSYPNRKTKSIAKALSVFRMVVWLARNDAKFDKRPTTSDTLICRIKNWLKCPRR